jgi:hypothetical protein
MDTMGGTQSVPAVVGRLSLEYEHGHDPSCAILYAVDVIQHLAQAKADLLVLTSAAQALDLSDVDSSATIAPGVEPGCATPRSSHIDAFVAEMGNQRLDSLFMGRRRRIDLIPVDAQRVPAHPAWRTTRGERRSEKPIANVPHDDHPPSLVAQPPASGCHAGQQIAEPVGVDDMDMGPVPAGFLGSDELAAVITL